MKTPLSFFKYPIADYPIDMDIVQETIRSAAQSTGFDQSIYEKHQSIYDVLKRIDELERGFEKLNELFAISIVSISALNSNKWKLRNPINVNIEQRASEDFVACLYDIDLYGYGDSIPEALDDFKEALVNHLEFLKDQEGKIELGVLPNMQLKFLDAIVTRIDA